MAGQYGVQNFLKVLDVVVEGGNISGAALVDGKITIADAGLILGLMDELMALGSVEWAAFPKELAELDEEDRAAIEAHFKAKFDIPQDKLEATIEAAVGLVFKSVALALEIAAFVKALKAPAPAPEAPVAQ